jgi:YfiH family protein
VVDLSPVTFPSLAALPWLRHGVTTRSAALPLDGNMSFAAAPTQHDAVIACRERWLTTIDRSLESAIFSGLVHATTTQRVASSDMGRGAFTPETIIPRTDALMTDTPGVTLVMCFGDCVPLLVIDPEQRVIALGHAGWRGTVRGMAGSLVRSMVECFGSDPQSLVAVVGPSISPAVYEVGTEVVDTFQAAYPGDGAIVRRGSSWYLDLWQANTTQLMVAGLRYDRVQCSGICTFANGARFFSHRYAKAHDEFDGRFAVMLSIEG